ncbi:MAG: hypothetical protein R3F43_03540 [bacterium]
MTAFGSRQGIAVTAGTARITDARVRGRIGASALGLDALLSLTRAYVNDDTEGDRLALAAGDGARLSLQGAAVRGRPRPRPPSTSREALRPKRATCSSVPTPASDRPQRRPLTGRDLDVAAPGTRLVALDDAVATAAYLSRARRCRHPTRASPRPSPPPAISAPPTAGRSPARTTARSPWTCAGAL